jgi:hypothetical protein
MHFLLQRLTLNIQHSTLNQFIQPVRQRLSKPPDAKLRTPRQIAFPNPNYLPAGSFGRTICAARIFGVNRYWFSENSAIESGITAKLPIPPIRQQTENWPCTQGLANKVEMGLYRGRRLVSHSLGSFKHP